MVERLVALARMLFGKTKPPPLPFEPDFGVRQPINRGGPSRSSANAVAEPDEDRAIDARARAVR